MRILRNPFVRLALGAVGLYLLLVVVAAIGLLTGVIS